ncbi:MAG: CHAT domain-containing protein, partial [Leptolyngbyaceae bacterium]|nr:CHAT domain-containing protein [Leptolyngbyaceae bacterium]
EADLLLYNGSVYYKRDQVQTAVETWQTARQLYQSMGNAQFEAITLRCLSIAYDARGDLRAWELLEAASALDAAAKCGAEMALPDGQQIRFRLSYESFAVEGLYDEQSADGQLVSDADTVYVELAYESGSASYYWSLLQWLNATLDRARDQDHPKQEVTTLMHLGDVYGYWQQERESLDYYSQALAAVEQHPDIDFDQMEVQLLHKLGNLHFNQENYIIALGFYQKQLELAQVTQDAHHHALALEGLGTVAFARQEYGQAREFFRQALLLQEAAGDREGTGRLLSKIGFLWDAANQPELAIVFLKQSVNIRESIRVDLQRGSNQLQQNYIESVAATYRRLADLLLQNNQLPEAQQVLDLLKVEELEEYLPEVDATRGQQAAVVVREPEQVIQQAVDDWSDRSITIQQELRQLEQKEVLTAAEEERLIALGQEAEQLIQAFNQFWDSEAVQTQVNRLRQNTGGESIDLSNYRDLQASLAGLQQNAALLYPLVLPDRLELVLVTPDADVPIRKTVAVGQAELEEAIASYRTALQNPSSNPLPLARQLYGWLLEPLAAELDTISAQTLIYAPDGPLRYLPLAALHDGNQWVTQRLRINNITAASLMDITRLPQQHPKVFAAALTEGTHMVPVGDRQFQFAGLPFAGREVEHLAALIPDTDKRLNQDFNPGTVPLMNRYSIVHLATHASFVSSDAENSFILFGDGTPISLSQVRNWRLPNVDLVVLSACQTGVGGELGDGREILGLGYQMQKAGANAAIASLWTVSDGGTQQLMDAFYAALNQGLSKTEALQQAQNALITGTNLPDLNLGSPEANSGMEGDRGIALEQTEPSDQATVSTAYNLSHPYYWAPFILIGNGL